MQSQQDELAQLFARNMIFTQPLPPSTPDKQFMMQAPAQPQIIYSSQHYTGAYHIHTSKPAPESRADSPLSMPVDELENSLRRNDIDPLYLSPSQVTLFTNADYDQRLRLIELWRIAPPENRGQAQSHEGVWPLTSLAQEEESARLRYERRMNERAGQTSMQQSSPEVQEAEPYVISGYANAQRIDPVYAAAAGAWQAPNYAQAVQDISMQHGAYQAQHMIYVQAQNDEMVM